MDQNTPKTGKTRSRTKSEGTAKERGPDQNTETPETTRPERPENAPEPVGASGDGGETDVLLDVPTLKVDEIELEVENLAASVSLQAEVLDLLNLKVGADVGLGRVHLGIKGVEAQALLKVRLDNVREIIARVLQTIDANPQILEQVTRGVGAGIQEVAGGTGRAVGALGEGAGNAVEDVGEGAGSAVKEVGEGAGDAVKDVGEGAGTAVKDVGEGAGSAVEDVGEGTENAVKDVGEGAGDTAKNASKAARGVAEEAGKNAGSTAKRKTGRSGGKSGSGK
ncbi:hypothetical protein ACFW31_01350 [Nocardiopsis alba]|uniref:hypothetical protein n=1 Tax=Nocardiopsis alba TaxID=53437 RepID=UPI00366DC184